MANLVKKSFRDKNTKKVYRKGDSYSHADENRIAFLIERGFLGEKSKQPPKEEIKHVGGGWYQLSNGEKVKGKEAAVSAAKEL